MLGHERCGAIKATVEAVHPPPVSAAAAHGDSHADPHGDAHGEPAHGDAHGEPAHGGPAHGDAHGAPAHGGPGRDLVDSARVEARDHIHLLVEALKPAVTAVDGKVPPSERLDAAIDQNVRIGVARLVRESPMLKSFLVSGRIRIAGARYDLDTGEVRLLRDRP